MLFIIEAVALGYFLKYTKFNKWINTAVAILLLVYVYKRQTVTSTLTAWLPSVRVELYMPGR